MQYQIAWPPFTRNVKITIIGLTLIFLVTVLSMGAFNFSGEYLMVSGPQVFERGRVWTLLTYAFFHQIGRAHV